jgi:hypothetical protein
MTPSLLLKLVAPIKEVPKSGGTLNKFRYFDKKSANLIGTFFLSMLNGLNYLSMKKLIYICLVIFLCSCKHNNTYLFTDLPPSQTGIKFKNIIRDTEEFNVLNYAYLYNGGGVAIGDINNDGLPDIYFTGNLVASHLYLNKGDLKFDDVTIEAGVTAEGRWNTGTTMVDINGDGFLDIYVCRSAARISNRRKNLLFINNQDLTFTECAEAYGLDDSSYSTHAVFFDYDCDGDLDAFILNHSLDQYAGFSNDLDKLKKQPDEKYADKLLRNDNNKFTDVSEEAGLINNVLGFGLGITILDVNGDNYPDMYVSNDYNEEDYLYINQKDGTFTESLKESMGHVSLSSMGNESGDFNNDLRPDIISLDMLPENHFDYKMSIGPENYDKYNQLISQGFHYQTLRNMLQLNNGNGTFSEIGQLAGIQATYWSWAPLLADYDNDGWKDLFISNGYLKNYLDMDVISFVVDEKLIAMRDNRQIVSLELLSNIPDLASYNYAYRNNGDLTFTKVTAEWGFNGNSFSNGTAYGDLDNDGDLDLVINNINEYAKIYRNNSNALESSNYIKIKLKGINRNTFGIGSKVFVKTGSESQYQELIPSRGFQSSMDPELLFGLGDYSTIDSILVIWPDSTVEIRSNVPSNQNIILKQQDAKKVSRRNSVRIPVFTKIETNLGIHFSHDEGGFNDFRIDGLIPRGLSRKGPGIAKGDVNNDGLEDVYIGGAKGQGGRLFQQNKDGTFKILPNHIFDNDRLYEDTDAVFLDADGDGDSDLYITSGGQNLKDQTLIQDRLYLNNSRGSFTRPDSNLPNLKSSNSCVSSADIDLDGDLDLFVGGQIIPGNYPLPPRSYILENNGSGIFTDITKEICEDLTNPGLVSDALFTDLDQDGIPDLVLVGEWMKIMVYLNKNGRFIESEFNGLENSYGWWNTVIAHDFNKDGRTDLAAGNMGMNNFVNASPENPARLFYNDFDKNGKIDPLMTYTIDGARSFAFSRDELIGQVNPFSTNFPDYSSFARLEEKDFLSVLNITDYDSLQASYFHTSIFINNGNGKFKTIPLPVEAQFSPVYSIHPTNINNDEYPDIVLGGNQSNTRVSTGKFDALYGLVLIGKGDGCFTSMDAVDSGIKVMGDVRSINEIENENGCFLMFFLNNGNPVIYRKSFGEISN